MPYFIKLYISIAAYKVIPTLIFNAILMWPNTARRYLKNAYRAYEALFRPKKEVWWRTV